MKQLLSLCCMLFGLQALYAQSQIQVPRNFTLSGKVHSEMLIPGHEYVYLYTNYQWEKKDSALVKMDSTFEFKFGTDNTPLAFSVRFRNNSVEGLLPPTGNSFLHLYQENSKTRLSKANNIIFGASAYDILENAVHKPFTLVHGKNLALVDSASFNRSLGLARDSAMMVIRQYQDSIHPALFKELQRLLALNTQMAYLDFALLKRLHQKEKSFDRVDKNYTQQAHLVLADSSQMYISEEAWQELKERVQALEAIEFQTSRFNPFENNCEQIDEAVLASADPQPDGLQCNYGLTGAVDLYLFDDDYLPGWLITPRFEKLTSFTKRYAIVVYNGRVGVIDACQNFTVQPNYSYLREFNVGKDAASPLYIFRGASNYGLLNPQGRHLLEENYDFLIQLDKARLAFRPANGTQYGVIDTSGKVLVPPKYDVIYGNSPFNGKYIVYNQHPFLKQRKRIEGTTIMEPIRLHGLIDSVGNEIVKPGWYSFEPRFFMPNKGYGIKWLSRKYQVLKRKTIQNNEGYISADGRVLAKPEYDRIAAVPNTEGYVLASNSHHVYLVNANGKAIKPVKFKFMQENLRGRAIVYNEKKYYVIDSLGNYEKYGPFEKMRYMNNEFKYKRAEVIFKSNGKWGLYSLLQQDWVIAPEWEDIDNHWKAYYFKKGNQWGFTNNRTVQVPTVFYDTIFQRAPGYYEAHLQQQKLILDSNGTFIFKTDADEVYHLNTEYFGDSNFIVLRGKQLYKIQDGKEIPLSLDKVSLLSLYDVSQTSTALVNRSGLIMGYGDQNYLEKLHSYDDESSFNPNLGNGNWHISNNGFECIIDEEANLKIPPVYRSIIPLISVGGKYSELSLEREKLEDAMQPRYYKVRGQKYKLGLYDAQFKMVLDSIYNSISIYGNRIYYANKKGLFVKELGNSSTNLIKKGRYVDVKTGDKIVVINSKGKRGIYSSDGKLILRPKKYKEINLDAGGLMAISKSYNSYFKSSYQLYLASGKRISREKYAYHGGAMGIAWVEDKKDLVHLVTKEGKDILQYHPQQSAYVRIANFSEYLSTPDTQEYALTLDTMAGLNAQVFQSKNSDKDVLNIVTGGTANAAEKDVINQALYLFHRLDIKNLEEYNPSLSKIKLSYFTYDYSSSPKYEKKRCFYFDADSLYGIYAEDVISDSTQVEFATMLVNTITADKNIKWETCVKPDRLFRFLSLEVDFSQEGLTFTTHSFKDINGDDLRREQFYTWQALAPYLNKNHVLSKRFFGLNQK
jgi:hypothetical protein